ncbi:MAG: type II toxin-antitoxin system VapC family toxin [Actinobacteria bacterium]|nr:MAG: type II toxin-antitoxin system VapC family toxin [Actinomycetota bacterium]
MPQLLADANVVVAAVVGDADAHGPLVAGMVADLDARGERFVVTEGVLAETAWVLAVRFGMSPVEIAGALCALLDSAGFDSWDPPLVTRALRVMAEEPRLDVVDALLAARDARGDGRVVTLDRILARAVAREHGR